MVFIDWRFILSFAAALAVFTGSIWGFRKVRSRAIVVRVPTRILSGLFAGMSFLLCLTYGCTEVATTHSTALYSPNRIHTIRSDDYDAGALGGWTAIYLYSDHGLSSNQIYSGLWKAVEIKDIRWLNDSEVLISYPQWSSDEKPFYCAGTNYVKVTCVAKPVHPPGN